MASIKKEGKYYKVYFRVGNKQFKRSTRTSSKQQAEKIKILIENDIAAGLFSIPKYSPHLQKGLEEFVKEAIEFSETTKAKKTAERESRVLRNFVNYMGDIPLSSINVKKIEGYKYYLKNERMFKSSGVNIELRHLSAAFSLAVKYEYIAKNPFKDVDKLKVPQKQPKYLTKQQAEMLLNSTKEDPIYHQIFLSLCTGARASEVVNLEWKDIDLNNKTLKIFGKGSKERTVPIPKILEDFLVLERNKTGKVCRKDIPANQLSKDFRKCADRVGLNRFTFHNLRDTYASWLVQKGVNILVIKELLGHGDISSTLLYAHLAPDNKFEAVKAIDNMLDK